jgi:hypothetical protein
LYPRYSHESKKLGLGIGLRTTLGFQSNGAIAFLAGGDEQFANQGAVAREAIPVVDDGYDNNSAAAGRKRPPVRQSVLRLPLRAPHNLPAGDCFGA